MQLKFSQAVSETLHSVASYVAMLHDNIIC